MCPALQQLHQQPGVDADHRGSLAQLHGLALGQVGKPSLIQAPELRQQGVVVGVHQGAVLGQRQRAALFQHLADELGAEIMPAALPADMQCTQDEPQRVEAVQLAPRHHVLGTAQSAAIGLVGDLQRIQRTGGVPAQAENTLVQVLLAGARREHGIAVFAGGAVQAVQLLIKRHGGVGIAGPGGSIDQFGQQCARAGEQDVDGFHDTFPLCAGRRSGRKSISYKTSIT